MSIEKVKAYFDTFGIAYKVLEFDVSSATVALAAQALGCEEARIAKTLSFQSDEEDGAVLVVAAGDARIDNRKFKEQFDFKARMLSPDAVLEIVGHAVGGVCPFAIENEKVKVYTDVSLRRFDYVYPACGSSNSAIKLSCEELFEMADSEGWVDVCKGWEEE